MWEKAVAYLRQAGLRAMARGAHREAVPYLEQALETLHHRPEIRRRSELAIDIHFDARNALNPLGDWARVGDHLQEAEVLARSLGDQHRVARIAAFMMWQRRVTGDYDAALKLGQEAIAVARTLGDRSLEVAVTWYLGDLHVVRGEYSEAAKLLERNTALSSTKGRVHCCVCRYRHGPSSHYLLGPAPPMVPNDGEQSTCSRKKPGVTD